jgi:hypothetical protein
MKGSISIDVLKGGYVVSAVDETGSIVEEVVTSKSKAIRLVKETLETLEGSSSSSDEVVVE